jgi:hypothetical protein
VFDVDPSVEITEAVEPAAEGLSNSTNLPRSIPSTEHWTRPEARAGGDHAVNIRCLRVQHVVRRASRGSIQRTSGAGWSTLPVFIQQLMARNRDMKKPSGGGQHRLPNSGFLLTIRRSRPAPSQAAVPWYSLTGAPAPSRNGYTILIQRFAFCLQAVVRPVVSGDVTGAIGWNCGPPR